MSSAELVALVLLLAIAAYACGGGADFGAGFWDLIAGNQDRGARPPRPRQLRDGDNVMRLVSAPGSQTGSQLRTETGAPNLDLPHPDGGWESRARQGSGANYGPTTDHDGRTQRTSTVNHGHER